MAFDFKPTIWSTGLIANLDKDLTATRIAQVERAAEGAKSIKYHKFADAVTVKPYTGSITYDPVPDGLTRELQLDQQQYVAIQVGDVEQAQTNLDLVAGYLRRSSQALATAVDSYIFSLYADAGVTPINLDVSATGTDSVYEALVEAQKRLNAKSVPQFGRVAFVNETMYQKLVLDNKLVSATALGDNIRVEGSIGRAAGFDLILTTNAPVASGKRKLMFGQVGSVVFGWQLSKVRVTELESAFATGVSMLYLYGAEVIQPDALGYFDVTE